jgi:trans-aconitate methyltransferase
MSILEVRIPISPRPYYYNRVAIIALSVRQFYSDAIIRVTVGSDEVHRDLHSVLPWSEELGIQWVWLSPNKFQEWSGSQQPYIPTIVERFGPPFGARNVLIIDADVLLMRPIDELFAQGNSLCGVMAHHSPFGDQHEMAWKQLFQEYGVGAPDFLYEHSGWPAVLSRPEVRWSPAYFNTGVLFASAALLTRLYSEYMNALAFVRGRMDTYLIDQIALSLAVAKGGVPVTQLPLKYNFPNQKEFDEAHPDQLADIRFLHFLRTGVVDRQRDFGNLSAIRALSQRLDLRGSNERLRHRIGELLSLFETMTEPSTVWAARARAYGRRCVVDLSIGEADFDLETKRQVEQLYPLLLTELTTQPGCVLDFGCGCGRFTESLRAVTRAQRCIGFDPCRQLSEMAMSSQSDLQCEFRTGSADKFLKRLDFKVDLIWIVGVFGGIDDAELLNLLSDLRAVLAPGGMLFCVEDTARDQTTNGFWHMRPIQTYEALLRGCGFNATMVGTYAAHGHAVSVFSAKLV